EPVVSVRACVHWLCRDAEGAAVVGGASPASPQTLRSGRRPALADRAFGVVGAYWVGNLRAIRRSPCDEGLREIPGVAVARHVLPLGARTVGGRDLLLHRWLERCGVGLRRSHGAALSRDLPGELRVPSVRHATLRDDRPEPQLLVGGDSDDG